MTTRVILWEKVGAGKKEKSEQKQELFPKKIGAAYN